MITWTDFNQQQPALADAGRRQFYQFGIGLAFLATVRPDGAPRVHWKHVPHERTRVATTPIAASPTLSTSAVTCSRLRP